MKIRLLLALVGLATSLALPTFAQQKEQTPSERDRTKQVSSSRRRLSRSGKDDRRLKQKQAGQQNRGRQMQPTDQYQRNRHRGTLVCSRREQYPRCSRHSEYFKREISSGDMSVDGDGAPNNLVFARL